MASIINASTAGVGGLITTADNSGVLQLQTGGTTAVTVGASQNVGIGTSSPSYKLDVTGVGRITGNADQQYNFRVQHGTTGFGLYQDDTTGYTIISAYDTSGTTYGKGLIFATAAAGLATTERMRIDSTGNVLVGTTNIVGGDSPKISVSGNACIATNTATTISTAAIGFHNPNGRIGYIGVSGTTTSYNTSSDYRLKENVAPMIGALNTVASLKPVTYNWKADGSYGQGFIAHELSEVVPDCVTGEKDAVDDEGNPQYQGIDTSFLVATLTAAIQELKAIVDTQAEQIKALQGASV